MQIRSRFELLYKLSFSSNLDDSETQVDAMWKKLSSGHSREDIQ